MLLLCFTSLLLLSRMIDPPHAAIIPLPVHIESVEFHGLLLLILVGWGGTDGVAVWVGQKSSTSAIVVFFYTL